MLGKAAEWGVIPAAPRIKLAKEYGRSAIIDSEAEFALLTVATQPVSDVLTVVLDSGMRPGEVFQMRVPMSDRVTAALHHRRQGQTDGWVFASDPRCGPITTVAKAFEQAREAAGLPKEVVLYSARHTFATKVMGATGDLSLVMRALGHSSAQTAMIYQHPSLERVRSLMKGGHAETLLRHNSRHTAIM